MDCSIDGCEKTSEKRTWCAMHYRRWHRHGDVDATRPPASERFWSKVDRDGPVPECRPDLGPCWLWTAGSFAEGYGMFYLDKRTRHAYQVSYEWDCGPKPEGLVLDHLCRVAGCVRPSHLEPVTVAENLRRGVGQPALNARKTECKHGHPLTGDNVLHLVSKNGRPGRVCRECRTRINLESYQRRRALVRQ